MTYDESINLVGFAATTSVFMGGAQCLERWAVKCLAAAAGARQGACVYVKNIGAELRFFRNKEVIDRPPYLASRGYEVDTAVCMARKSWMKS